jgi:hypothetical protein
MYRFCCSPQHMRQCRNKTDNLHTLLLFSLDPRDHSYSPIWTIAPNSQFPVCLWSISAPPSPLPDHAPLSLCCPLEKLSSLIPLSVSIISYFELFTIIPSPRLALFSCFCLVFTMFMFMLMLNTHVITVYSFISFFAYSCTLT